MKKVAALAALALAMVPALAKAQSVNVTVQVAATASGTAVGTLDLGSLAPGASATVSPGAASGVGAVQITHTGNFSIGAASNTATLTGPGSDLTVTLSCQYRDAATSGTALAPTAASAVNCNAVPNWTAGGNTAVYLQVGGSITVPAAQTSGTYNGTVSFTVTAL